ncbi:MAG: CYTH domain-containing protein, partial [Rhodospirillaceae bacterium]
MTALGVQEQELKLSGSLEALDAVLALPLMRTASGRKPAARKLRSIYFDTPDQVFRQAGYSLRVRQEGRKQVMTLKGSEPEPGGLAGLRQRLEWETVVSGPTPDWSHLQRWLQTTSLAAVLLPDPAPDPSPTHAPDGSNT